MLYQRHINNIICENLDGEGRSYKNMIQMMTDDGIMYVLPKYGDGWIDFLIPFLKLIRKEKNNNTIVLYFPTLHYKLWWLRH